MTRAVRIDEQPESVIKPAGEIGNIQQTQAGGGEFDRQEDHRGDARSVLRAQRPRR
jgi:hypothetical protein